MVRPKDNLLIKIPNEAYKLNPQGVKLLQFLLSGKSVQEILQIYPNTETIAADIQNFFCDLRALLKGCLHEYEQRRAVEHIPFTLRYNTLPVLSELAVTYRCNLTCKFCYAGCGCKKKPDTKELTTKNFKKVISLIRKEAQVPSISFTGGEPLLRKDLPELITHAKSLKMWTNLITNATLLTKPLAQRLKQARLDSAQISLEAGNASQHDEITGVFGSFKKTLHGLELLRKAGIAVHTNTTISSFNKNNLREIVDLTRALGLNKLSMNMLMPQGSALQHIENLFITYTEIGKIVLDMLAYAQSKNIQFLWYSPTPACIFNPIVHGLGNKACAACDGLLSITPIGDILPCSSYPKTLANILAIKGKFSETWESAEFRFFQEKKFAHDQCQACEHLALCNGGCPLYWQYAGFQELTQLKEAQK